MAYTVMVLTVMAYTVMALYSDGLQVLHPVRGEVHELRDMDL